MSLEYLYVHSVVVYHVTMYNGCTTIVLHYPIVCYMYKNAFSMANAIDTDRVVSMCLCYNKFSWCIKKHNHNLYHVIPSCPSGIITYYFDHYLFSYFLISLLMLYVCNIITFSWKLRDFWQPSISCLLTKTCCC